MFYHACCSQKSFYAEERRKKVVGICVRASVHICACLFSALAFRYADKSNVNQGVIAGLFNSAAVYAAILFYVFHGEKIDAVTFAGMVSILAGVCCIGIKPERNQGEIQYTSLLLSILFAQLTGLAYAVNSITVKYFVQHADFTPTQLNIDGMMVASLPMTLAYAYF